MSKIAQIIGKRIRNIRNHHEWNQETLAELAGFHPTYIGQVERGEKNLTIESLEKISIALQVPLSDLFEKLGGKSIPASSNYPLLAYELFQSKTLKEQKKLYQILLDIEQYK